MRHVYFCISKMNEFKSYLIAEFKDKAKGFVAVDFKFNHSNNVKIDRKSNVPLRCDIMKVNIAFYDKDMIKLFYTIIPFENDVLQKTTAKKLINISPKELENKFKVAKKAICKEILDELCDKKIDLERKISDLNRYIGSEGIIPNQFKGELINPVVNPTSNDMARQGRDTAHQRCDMKLKVKFDM